MGQQFLIIATGVEQGVGQDGEASSAQGAGGQLMVIVDGLSDARDEAAVRGEGMLVTWARRLV
jgi:hypothetical protein